MKLLPIIIFAFLTLNTNSQTTCKCDDYVPNCYSTSGIFVSSAVCSGCEYVTMVPSGYSELRINYQYKEDVQLYVYQNSSLIDYCPSYKTCTMSVKTNVDYPITLITTRSTSTSSTSSTSSTHGMCNIEYISPMNSTNNCSNAPQLNAGVQYQGGYFTEGCYYDYSQSMGKNFILDMSFKEMVTIELYYNSNILYKSSDYNHYKVFNLSSQTQTQTQTDVNQIDMRMHSSMSNSSGINGINWINFYTINANMDDMNNNDSKNNLYLAGFVISIIIFMFIFIFVFFSCLRQNSYISL